MYSRRLKTGYFVLEGFNSFATVCYFYYFYFFMQQAFGFGNKANLALAALNGGTYALFSWQAGKLAQRWGYFNALKLGFGLMLAAMAAGPQVSSATGQVIVMLVADIGMCFTWPTLEALVSEEEEPAGLQHMVGVYNVVWAATGFVAYFLGGAMLDRLGLKSLFYAPAVSLLLQLVLTFWLASQARSSGSHKSAPVPAAASVPLPEPHRPSPKRAKCFLRMAWLANPFGYIAINTLIAVMPGIAGRLGLSTTLAGFCCSVWCFARLAAFTALWRWNGWHYRFRWLLLAFLILIVTFATILLVPNLAVLVVAQLFLGLALGLIYYSSLFYSMDLSETKSEHGGIHEAAIGLGNFTGPVVGAATLHFLPQYGHSGAVAVSLLLLCGLGGLTAIWRTGQKG